MVSINIVDRPSSQKSRALKKFAKKKSDRIAKADNEVRKPVFKKNVKLPKLKDTKGKCFY